MLLAHLVLEAAGEASHGCGCSLCPFVVGEAPAAGPEAAIRIVLEVEEPSAMQGDAVR